MGAEESCLPSIKPLLQAPLQLNLTRLPYACLTGMTLAVVGMVCYGYFISKGGVKGAPAAASGFLAAVVGRDASVGNSGGSPLKATHNGGSAPGGGVVGDPEGQPLLLPLDSPLGKSK